MKPNRIAAVVVSGSLILSLSGPPALAVPAQDPVVDGEPTAAACAPYGFGLTTRVERNYAGSPTPPPPPHPPPPPPPPPA
ncbi:VWA domain-containing protein, partial [Brevundimonas sp. A19_0]|nr:VWA domain-containing protein [Brevundimonas sp. A19_0]